MKKLLFPIAIAISCCLSLLAHAQDDLLATAEQQIEQTFLQSMQGTDAFPALLAKLDAAGEGPEARYWQAYARYMQSLALYQLEEEKAAEKAIKKSIKTLEEIEKTDSEALALHSTVTGFSIQFSMWKAPFLGNKAESLAKEAIAADAENPRAYLALARNSYYKPAMFGGGEGVEENLLKVLSLSAATDKSAANPVWGLPEAFFLLASHYRNEERPEEALLYCKKGLKQFPDDYRLGQLLKKLEPSGTTGR